MKLSLVALALILTAPLHVRAAPDPATEASALFAAGNYTGGLNLLNRYLRNRAAPAAQRARCLIAKARFYEKYVGDPTRAKREYRQVARLALPDSAPSAREARTATDRLAKLEQRHSALKQALDRIAVRPRTAPEREEQIRELREMLERSPDNPYMGLAHYYLGVRLAELKRYARAHAVLTRAELLYPAIGFALPVPYRRQQTFGRWLRKLILDIAWTALGLLLCGVTVLFATGRPWRWLGARHVIAVLLACLCWWLFFRGLVAWSGHHAALVAESDAPVFISSAPGAPLSASLHVLFRYGLAGTLGAFAIAIAVARLRLRWTGVLLNVALSATLFTALVAVFTLRHCATGLASGTAGPFPHLTGTYHFETTELEPFMLTNPRRYPGLALDELDEPPVVEFMAEHYRAMREGTAP